MILAPRGSGAVFYYNTLSIRSECTYSVLYTTDTSQGKIVPVVGRHRVSSRSKAHLKENHFRTSKLGVVTIFVL